jgi:hypothetical protein
VVHLLGSTIESCLRTEPNDANARGIGLSLHGNRGYALSALGRHQESAKEWARVVELSKQPVPPEYRVRLAVELISAGDTGQAEAQLAQPISGISGNDCYNFACIFSRAAAEVSHDQSVPSNQRARRVEAHISNAFRWLKAAAETGIFGKSERRDQAKKDANLEKIRDRPVFCQIIEAAGSKP